MQGKADKRLKLRLRASKEILLTVPRSKWCSKEKYSFATLSISSEEIQKRKWERQNYLKTKS